MAKKIEREAQVQNRLHLLMIRAIKLHCKEKGMGSHWGQFCSQSNTETIFYHTSEQGFGEDKDDYLLPLICGSLQSGKREKQVKRSR